MFQSSRNSVEIRYQSRFGGRGRVAIKYYMPRVFYVAPKNYRPTNGDMGDDYVLQSGDNLRLFPGRYEGMGYCNVLLVNNYIIESVSGSKWTVIDCQNAFRGWQLSHTTGLTVLSGICFTGCKVTGSATTGAALLVVGNTLIDSCTFQNNNHKAQGTDNHMQIVKTEHSVVVTLNSLTPGAELIGTIQMTASAGICNFSDAGIRHLPGQKVIVEVSSPPLVTLSNVTVPIRKCIRGEIIPVGTSQCVKCTFGKFSWNISDNLCHDCPEGAVCNGGDSIEPLAGYWRLPNTTGVCKDSSDPFDNCKLNSCLDGPNNTMILTISGDSENYQPNDTLYIVGYPFQVVSAGNGRVFIMGKNSLPTEGSVAIYYPAEEACSVGYKGNLCLQCEHGYIRSGKSSCVLCPSDFTLTILALIGGMIGVVVVVVVLIRMALNKAKKKRSLTSIASKIFTSYLQLVFLAQSFEVNWPREVIVMFNLQSFVANPSDKLISISCLLDYYTSTSNTSRYYSNLELYLALPLIGVTIPSIFWGIRYYRITSTAKSITWQVSDKRTIGPNELEQLYTILGLPVVALYVLHQRRKKLDEFGTKLRLGFLYMGFKPEYFYWEIWITQRKVIVSFISVFLKSAGTGPEALAATVLVFIAYHLQMVCQPFENQIINELEQMSLLTSLFTLFGGLFLYQVEIIGISRAMFGVLVVTWNIIFCIIFARLMFIQVKDTAAHVIRGLSGSKSAVNLVGKLQNKRKRYQVSTAKVVATSGHQ
ncbi:hypothetical protein AeMF1_009695 [Aphanomyces euteiches]|nr:hypothetical protein AeMF1_009695 [Aphanomyces euteiches]KAH9196951.1 hypothetical protein AeNC1_001072 [Aphanomyces euteiches]